jgi:carboxyl-terminal processing protease
LPSNWPVRLAARPWPDETFVQLLHNAARSDNNVTRTFNDETAALGLDRLVIIATGRTASASELIVTGLRPFMEVEIIGDTTFGKPVGSYGFEVCDLLLFPTAFELRNADGEGDYFDGLAPSCEAADDTDLPFGDPAEASLAQALHFVESGSCDGSGVASARERAAMAHRPQLGDAEGWHPRNAGRH